MGDDGTDLHYAAALLNSFLRDIRELQNNGDAKMALNRVVRKMCGPLGVRFDDVMAEMTLYEEEQGPWNPIVSINIREAHILPHQWWHRGGGNALPIIAKRILSLTVSASSCERNWSMYSFVHSKSRNRLGVEKAEELVYIYTNSKLLRERRGADPVVWYDDNILSEDSDPDAGDGDACEDSDGDIEDGDNDDDAPFLGWNDYIQPEERNDPREEPDHDPFIFNDDDNEPLRGHESLMETIMQHLLTTKNRGMIVMMIRVATMEVLMKNVIGLVWQIEREIGTMKYMISKHWHPQ